MTSPAKIAANRENAKRSTGPRTEEGKKTSSRNALTHGLRAHRHHVVHDEDETAYQEFVEGVIRSLGPEDAFQEALAQRVATGLWRLRRAADLETLIYRMARFDAHTAQGLAVAFALVRDDRYSAAIERLGRAEQRLERSVANALEQLDARQRAGARNRTNPKYPVSNVRRISDETQRYDPEAQAG